MVEGSVSKEVEKYGLFTFNELKQQLDEVRVETEWEVDSNGLHEEGGSDGWAKED